MSKIDNYERLSSIGEGTYGYVFKAINKKTRQVVALKKIKLENEDEGIPSTAMRQISILKELNPHPNIISLEDVDYQPGEKKLHLIFEFADHDLKKYLGIKKKDLSQRQIKIIMYQLVRGVDFCHARRIIHRDLKPQNLLIDLKGLVKIADFGLARAFGLPLKTLTHEIQTLWYRAPEILLGQRQYSLGVDIWAVGCIFAEMMERKVLFVGDSEIDQIFKIFQFHGTPTPEKWQNITKLPDMKKSFPKFKPVDPLLYFKNFEKTSLDLLLKMIALDPSKRISMKQALKHKYFEDLSEADKWMYK